MYGDSRSEFARILTANFMAATTPGSNVLVDQDLLRIKQKLDLGSLKLTDASIYSTKDASNQRLVRLFETSDVEGKGITNITAGKLSLDQYVLIDSVAVYAANSSAAINGSAAVLGGLDFATIGAHGNLQGGSLTIKQQNKNIVYQLSLRPFANVSYNETNARGVFRLQSPILLRPQQLIEANIELGLNLPDKQAIRIELRGTQTSPF